MKRSTLIIGTAITVAGLVAYSNLADSLPRVSSPILVVKPMSQGSDIPSVVSRVKDSVVRVEGGSGVVIATDRVVTCNHVVAKKTQLNVVIDGKEVAAVVVRRDTVNDLAILKVNAELTPVEIRSDDAELGEPVLVIGSPLGLDKSLSVGVVSGVRQLKTASGIQPVIQTDAAINPGNSGGAMFDSEGHLIGIVNGRLENQVQGIGFAIPVNLIKE